MKFFKKFIRNTEAATAIEYGLIAALIAVAAIAALGTVGDNLKATFENVGGELAAGAAGAGGGGGDGGETPPTPE